jgi:hypothetical protein
LRLSLRFTKVNQPVAITAPDGGRPLRELERRLDRTLGRATPRGMPA